MYLIDGITGAEQYIGQGYSGNGIGYNNPSAQNLSEVRPIPEGLYRIEAMRDNIIRRGEPNQRVMQSSMRLTPLTNIGNRGGFLIHHDFGVRTASNGCICAPLNVGQNIANTNVNRLMVVR